MFKFLEYVLAKKKWRVWLEPRRCFVSSCSYDLWFEDEAGGTLQSNLMLCAFCSKHCPIRATRHGSLSKKQLDVAGLFISKLQFVDTAKLNKIQGSNARRCLNCNHSQKLCLKDKSGKTWKIGLVLCLLNSKHCVMRSDRLCCVYFKRRKTVKPDKPELPPKEGVK